MRLAFVTLALAALGTAHAGIELQERPQTLYSSVSPKLRIEAKSGHPFTMPSNHVTLKFTPRIKAETYELAVSNDNVISVNLKKNKRWGTPHTTNGMTLYLDELNIDGVNQLSDSVEIATIIPTPTIKTSDYVIYQSATTHFMINGTNFREKNLELKFEPELVKNKDYIVSVKSSTSMVLTRTTGSKWSPEPGPLKLKRINTGAGALRIDPTYGGVTVALVQANKGAHGVTVESTPEQKLYQSAGALVMKGTGFNPEKNSLRFANSLRGRGVNYTMTQTSATKLTLSLTNDAKTGKKSKWRANPAHLPGKLLCLAVDAGAGFVPVGPTEAKKGRTVATVFEDPVVDKNTKTLYRTHSPQLWVTGQGFTRGAYQTTITLEPPLKSGEDYALTIYNRTHMLLSLFEGREWYKTDGAKTLRMTKIDTGAGNFPLFHTLADKAVGGVQIAELKPNSEDHKSGITVTRTTQTLYQSAAIRKLVVTGTGFTETSTLTFDPPLTLDVDYTQKFVDATKLILSLKKNRKWAAYETVLVVKLVKSGGNPNAAVVVGSGGEGVQVATIKADPTIDESKRIIYNSHTKRLFIRGSGFSIDGTEVSLSPTSRGSYEVESVEYDQIVLKLVDDKKWMGSTSSSKSTGPIMASKIDTGAGEVIFKNDIQVAQVEADDKDNHCDDSCEWALDGVCDDGTGTGSSPWFDDDYGGMYAYNENDDFYGYGYGGDDYLGPVCDTGTDCTDCGGPPAPDTPAVCDNSCQWSNDGFCDDTRTTGLCNSGTDCHDCGPVGASNFSSLEDDGWWDDDDNYWELDDVIPYEEGLQSDSNKKSAQKPGGKKGGLDGDSDASATVMSGMGYTFIGFLFAFCSYSTIQHLRTPVDQFGKYSKVGQEPEDGEEDLDKIG